MTQNVSQRAKDFILSLSEGALGLTFSFDKSSQVKETLFVGETEHLLNELIFLRSKLTPPSFEDPMTAVKIKRNILNLDLEGTKASLMRRFANPQEICEFLRGP